MLPDSLTNISASLERRESMKNNLRLSPDVGQVFGEGRDYFVLRTRLILPCSALPSLRSTLPQEGETQCEICVDTLHRVQNPLQILF